MFKNLHQLLIGSPFINPSLYLLAAIGLLASWKVRSQEDTSWLRRCGLWLLWMVAVWWFATHRIDRFWVPAFPVLALLAGQGVASLASRGLTRTASGVALLGIGYGVLQAMSGTAQNDRRYLVDLQSLTQEHRGQTSAGYLTPIAWLNEQLTEGNRVLCVGEAKVFDFVVPVRYATCFNTNPGEHWLSAVTPEEARSRLTEEAVTHVLVNWSEIDRYRSPGNYGFSKWPSRDDIRKLVSSGVLQQVEMPFEPAAVELFEVSP